MVKSNKKSKNSKTKEAASGATSPPPIEIEEEGSDTDTQPPLANGSTEDNSAIEIEDESSGEDSDETKSLRSYVWKHFKKYKKIERKKVNGVVTKIVHKRAKCIHCPKHKGDYAACPEKNGTTALKRHLDTKCVSRNTKDIGQMVLTMDKTSKNKLVARGFNQNDVMNYLIEMVVIDEMPFSTVDKPGFRKFCSVAIPEFKVPSRRLFVKEFFFMYEDKKNFLRKEMATHRVNLTTDTWTSVQNLNYMVLTAHFIDSDWVMHKRILSFCQIPNHQGVTISRLIETCLLDWKIDKILTITVDNASANKTALENLKAKMNRWENSKSILEGRFLHVRCTAHIVNLIVGHGLRVLNKSVVAIRNAVSFVRSSSHRTLAFRGAIEIEKIPCKSLVVLDVPTRWNSTYLMLKAALIFRKAFERLEDDEASYRLYFNEPEAENENFDEDDIDVVGVISPTRKRNRVGPPTALDWEKAEKYVTFLKLFYDITVRVSSSLKPTVHRTFHDIMSIEIQLNTLYVPRSSPDEVDTRTELDKICSDMSLKMNLKYDKYFKRYKDVNQLILVALILDPRFKMKNIAHLLGKEGYGESEVKQKTDDLTSLLKELYESYKVPAIICGATHSSNTSCSGPMRSSNGSGLALLDDWMDERGDEIVKEHEVDKYLTDPFEKYVRGVEIDILLWWKLNGPLYPILAAIAKDVLSIQASTVASESCFSTGGRIIDFKRSSLTPRSVQALICLQNWLKGDDISSFVEDEPSIEVLEFYESCESEISNGGLSTASN